MSIPAFISGMSDLETQVFITDRDNESRIPLDAVEFVQPDWDIDRSGSKARLDIETFKRTLEDGMWLAPYQVITPETGDISNQQTGHFRIETPSALLDGSVDFDGEHKVVQRASGGDIVGMMARARLSETFYTPIGGVVMEDVRLLLKLATVGRVGPNRVINGGFEAEGSGWIFPAATTSATSSWTYPGMAVIEGAKQWAATFAPNASAGYIAAYRDFAVPKDFTHLYVMGERVEHSSGLFSGQLSARFLDSAGNALLTATNIEPRAVARYRGQTSRHFAFGKIPEDAATVRIFVFQLAAGGHPSQARTAWDDIRVGGCTSMPLPDHRINLPPSTAAATTRIQTTAGSSFVYDAINADRLSSIGHHAIYTQQDGVLTTSPTRDLTTAVPKRTYGRQDVRFVGDIQIERSATNRHNHFMAIKEDFQNVANTWIAQSFNNNRNDPWSIQNMPLSTADPIMMPDAVDQAALQAAAHAARDRASEQEMLRIQVVPDPGINVHDVIEITDSDLPEAIGKWSIEYIRPGMSPSDPLTEIMARRNRSSQGVI